MKSMKKLLSFLLVAAMVMAMSVTALAADYTASDKDDTSTTSILTINTASGHSYQVYEMLTGDVSGLSDGSGTLSNVVIGANNSATDVTTFDAAIKDEGVYLTGTDLSDAASEYITGTAVATVEGNGSAKTVEVVDGYYVVKDVYTDNGKACAAYMVAVAGETTMNPKTDTPSIDKNITDDDANAALEGATATSKKTDTAAIGDVINYELTSAVPVTEGYKYYYYVVDDTLSKGLTLCAATDFVVTIGSETLTQGTEDDQYQVYVTKNDDGTTNFKLAIMDMKQFTAGAAISITYTATVNKDAEIGLTPNTNTVKLQYSNNPEDTFDYDKEDTPDKPGVPDEPGTPGTDEYNPGLVLGETTNKITKTYVTQLTIQKIDATEGTFIDALKTAEFTLTGAGLNDVKLITETYFAEAADGETAQYWLLKDGTYTKTAPVFDEDGATADLYEEPGTASSPANAKYVTKTLVSCTNAESGEAESSITATVNSSGQITFTGLNAGSYTLEETKVPTGYNKAATLSFSIGAAQDGTTSADAGTAITWSKDGTDQDAINLDAATGVFNTTIENEKGNTLPSTGGIGTTIFYVLGSVLVIGAGVILVAKRRVSR